MLPLQPPGCPSSSGCSLSLPSPPCSTGCSVPADPQDLPPWLPAVFSALFGAQRRSGELAPLPAGPSSSLRSALACKSQHQIIAGWEEAVINYPRFPAAGGARLLADALRRASLRSRIPQPGMLPVPACRSWLPRIAAPAALRRFSGIAPRSELPWFCCGERRAAPGCERGRVNGAAPVIKGSSGAVLLAWRTQQDQTHC